LNIDITRGFLEAPVEIPHRCYREWLKIEAEAALIKREGDFMFFLSWSLAVKFGGGCYRLNTNMRIMVKEIINDYCIRRKLG